MADSSTLPGLRSWPQMPPEWWRFFRDLAATPEATTVDLSGYLPITTGVTGSMSVRSIGTLESGFVNFQLVNDSPAPGATYYYGTNEAGAKGFYPGVAVTYETVSKNLKSWDATFAYSLGVLDTITYTDGVDSIVKTFGYTLGVLTTITLSGDTPGGIDLVKTLTYSGADLATVGYA